MNNMQGDVRLRAVDDWVKNSGKYGKKRNQK